jgi:predicted DsbA family dithiol-disulfide isomerase
LNTKNERVLQLQIVSDVICPWCFIGKRSLDKAINILAEQGIDVQIDWLPYQLNPEMPAAGMDRKEFRSKRFGWDTALAMDARAVDAGRRVGAEFNYQIQTRTPNTVAAHALVKLARSEGGAELQARVVEGLFAGYFTHGKDTGDHDTLEQIAVAAGMAPGAVQRSLSGHADIRKLDAKVKSMGLNGVPSYLVDGRLFFSGSQDVEGYVRHLSNAAKQAA